MSPSKIDDITSDQMWDFCHFVLKESGYWYDHPSGAPTPEPTYADRMIQGPFGWEIDFGSHYFLVEVAIRRMWAALFEQEPRADTKALLNCIQVAVADQDHNLVSSPFELSGEFIVFGIHGISVVAFSQAFVSRVNELQAPE